MSFDSHQQDYKLREVRQELARMARKLNQFETLFDGLHDHLHDRDRDHLHHHDHDHHYDRHHQGCHCHDHRHVSHPHSSCRCRPHHLHHSHGHCHSLLFPRHGCCDDRIRLRLGGLHDTLGFRLMRAHGCDVEIETGDNQKVKGTVCSAGADFVDIRQKNKTIVTLLRHEIKQIHWKDDCCRPCDSHSHHHL